jgi:hypothetical protein
MTPAERTTPHEAGKAVIGRLYDVVCGGDATVPARADAFLTWCRPGAVMRAEDFDFCARGLATEVDPATQHPLLRQAQAVADLLDVAPAGGGRLSTVYAEILRSCRVARGELSDEDALKVGKFRDLLRATRKITDPVTGEHEEVTEDGPMVRAYQDKQAGYLHATMRYNARRLAGGPAWADAAERCRGDVRAAMDAWVRCGYRNEVDQVTAYLDQVGGRSLVPWRRHLVALLDGAMVNRVHVTGTEGNGTEGNGTEGNGTEGNGAGISGGEAHGTPAARGGFPYTALVPVDFATSAACWVDIAVDDSDVAAGGGPSRSGLPSWRSGAAGVSFDVDGVHGLSRFALRLRLCQVVISRPWLYPRFFANRGWTLDGGPVCDGGDPPSGRLVGYPAAALLIRDLRLDCPELVAARSRHADRGSTDWGPFQLARGQLEGGCISVPGIQLIGLVNEQFGRAPNPLPQLDTAAFV